MIIEPLKQDKKLSDYLVGEGKAKNVLIVFWHGLGDVVQFADIFEHLKKIYPDTHFDIALQNGLEEETIIPTAKLINNLDNIEEGYDVTALIHFPVETDPTLTKSELCCKLELGIEPYSHYRHIWSAWESPLVAVHFNLTCLPDLVRPSEEVAMRIWEEIIEADRIPIEVHFKHIYHNPVNTKFDFIDCTVRSCHARMYNLLGLLSRCYAFIGVVSGPFHCAMAMLDHKHIAYLEKDIPLNRFTHEPMKSFDLKDYKGGVKEWLKEIENGYNTV